MFVTERSKEQEAPGGIISQDHQALFKNGVASIDPTVLKKLRALNIHQ